MAAPSFIPAPPPTPNIKAGILDLEFNMTGTFMIATRTTLAPLAASLGPADVRTYSQKDQKEMRTTPKQLEELRRTRICYISNDFKGSVFTWYPLPDIQPIIPNDWKAEDWEDRVVVGSGEYHVYCSGREPRKFFALQIEDQTRKSGYVHIDRVNQPGTRGLEIYLRYLHKLMKENGKLLYGGIAAPNAASGSA